MGSCMNNLPKPNNNQSNNRHPATSDPTVTFTSSRSANHKRTNRSPTNSLAVKFNSQNNITSAEKANDSQNVDYKALNYDIRQIKKTIKSQKNMFKTF